MHVRLSARRLPHRLILAVLLFALVSVCAVAQQAAPVSPALQELRDIATQNPLRILQMLPDSPTFARIQTRSYDFKETGRPMEYELFVPSRYNSSRPTPLIVALHCLSAVAHDVIRYEHLTELAEAPSETTVASDSDRGRAPVAGWFRRAR